MIKVTVLVGKGAAGTPETISAASIREAVSIARARHPEEQIRVAFPIDPESFFPRQILHEAADFR